MRVARQNDLFEKAENEYPEGFRYKNDLISPAEEQEFLRNFADLPFKEFEFQGFVGRRRVVSFGWRYDFNRGGAQTFTSNARAGFFTDDLLRLILIASR